MEDRKVDQETVERTKGKLMQKAAEKRAERREGGGESSGVAEARRKFVENRRLQGID